jgi:hypothetical protein
MALVSPGLNITVIDESQYVSSAVGTVPFVLLATAQDKLHNGSVASYTTKAKAGQLLAVTSQRDVVTNLGTPTFHVSSAGTPLHGNETNEYGLMALYSALGACNLAYIIRADIDLAQIEGTAERPIGAPVNGAYWLDLTKSAWGVYEWNSVTQTYTNRTPLVITGTPTTASAYVTSNAGVWTPTSIVGTVGSYAIMTSQNSNNIFYKDYTNIWQQVGSTGWQQAWPVVTSYVNNSYLGTTQTLASVLSTSSITINGKQINNLGTTTSTAYTAINSAIAANLVEFAGVTLMPLTASNGQISIMVTSTASSTGTTTADGKIIIEGSPASAALGLCNVDTNNTPQATEYFAPALEYGSYVNIPSWRSTDATPAPSGSVWLKTSVLGSGASLVINEYSNNSNSWVPQGTPVYADDADAIYHLDPFGGGNGISAGSIYIRQNALGNNTASLSPFIRQTQGVTKVTGTASASSFSHNALSLDSFTISATQINTLGWSTPVTITLSAGAAAVDFVAAILNANIPNVSAALTASGAITITHTAGGSIIFENINNQPLTAAGITVFNAVSNTAGLPLLPGSTTQLLLSNFSSLTYTYNSVAPYTPPADGTLWYFNSPLDVDIMVNDIGGWKGYKNVSRDARGYNLASTDANGPILSPIAPNVQSDGTTLVAGDLWINTGDLVNFPIISRWTGTTWQLINNTDSISQNGIVFADARWDNGSGADPIADALPSITGLLTSNYTDLDCPAYQLYPRGTLLFNLRRSGYNIKHYMSDYFNANSFQEAYDTGKLPAQKATWVTSSGLYSSGSKAGAPYMGAAAQRNMVVAALKAALDGNETILESSFQFNLITCPGYPELIVDMVALNNNRQNTAFIIGDTPMQLPADVMKITTWSIDSDGTGLATADPYMAVYYPSGLSTDLTGTSIAVPPSHMILRAAIKSDNVSYPWFAYAGTRRGLIDNATDIGVVDPHSGAFIRNGINQGMRDALYPLAINPITILPGIGLLNFGNKTRVGVASSLDRVSVARLVNYIRTIFATVGNGFFFEPNDSITRNQLANMISSSLNDLVTKRGIYDYAVVCDASNNPPDIIAQNELYVDVAISPMRDVEFIYIPIRLMNPGTIK